MRDLDGNYTAVVRGVGNTTGTGVVDAYDLSAGSLVEAQGLAVRRQIERRIKKRFLRGTKR